MFRRHERFNFYDLTFEKFKTEFTILQFTIIKSVDHELNETKLKIRCLN